MDVPAPSPEMVSTARTYLTDRYAAGVDRLLWDTGKRLMPDLDAIRSVLAAASSGKIQAPDAVAALVLIHAARLNLDRLEYGIFETAQGAGMDTETLAAVLELPDAQAARDRQHWLQARHALPHADTGRVRTGQDPAQAAARPGRRSRQTAQRTAGAGRPPRLDPVRPDREDSGTAS